MNVSKYTRLPLISVALAACLAAASAGIMVVLVNSSNSAAEIREEAAEALLLAEMQSSLETTSAYTAGLVANLGPMGEMVTGADGEMAMGSDDEMVMGPDGEMVIGSDGDHFELTEDGEVAEAIRSFRTSATELQLLLGSGEGATLDSMVDTHHVYEDSMARLHDLEASDGDAMGAYHGGTQLLESDLRNGLLELQTAEALELQSAIQQSEFADRATRLLVPLLAGLALLIAGYLIWMQSQRRRGEIKSLQQVSRDKDEFVASVSHELRTPLTVIFGFLEVLQADDGTLSSQDREEMLTLAAREARDLTELVEDLLVIAKSDVGGLHAMAVPISLRAQLAQVLESDPHGVEVQIEGEAPEAVGDPNRVRQILRNLISNAVRYGGDHITVRLEGSISDGARLLFIDDGAGIPFEDQGRIFEPYQRAHNAPGVTGSIGLGLAVSLRLARVMGGDLTYRYVNGQSIFEFALPARQLGTLPPNASRATVAV